jgi:hypothetical protein
MKAQHSSLAEAFYDAILRGDRWLDPSADIPSELLTREIGEFGFARWAPTRQATSVQPLEKIYATVPGRLPKLFEECLASFRWLRVEIGPIEFFAHPPGPDCEVFVAQIVRDCHLFPALFTNRYIEFGKAAGGSYDPVCFDLKRGRKQDCPLVRIDHESVLIRGEPKVVSEIAPSFRAFVEAAT